MTVPFEVQIATAAEACLLALRQHGREVAGIDVDDHIVVVAKGRAAKALAEALALEDPPEPTRVPARTTAGANRAGHDGRSCGRHVNAPRDDG